MGLTLAVTVNLIGAGRPAFDDEEVPMFRRALALTLGLALGGSLVACGGGGDDAGDNPFAAPTDIDSTDADAGEDRLESPDPGGEADTSGGSTMEGSIDFALPAEVDVPSGFAMIGDNCEGDERGAGVRFVHPEDWELTGRSRGGSGAPIDGSIGHTFTTADDWVYIEVSSNTDTGGLQEEDETAGPYDYDYTAGDREGTVTYDQTMTVNVADQELEVWEVDETSYPDIVDDRQLKLDVMVFEVTPGGGMSPITTSVTVTIDLPIDSSTDDDVIQTIIGSLNVSECTRDLTTLNYEVITGSDLDGDGEIASAEDLMAALD